MTPEEKEALIRLLLNRDALSERLAELTRARFGQTVSQGEAATHGESGTPKALEAIAALLEAPPANKVGIQVAFVESLVDLIVENNQRILLALLPDDEGHEPSR